MLRISDSQTIPGLFLPKNRTPVDTLFETENIAESAMSQMPLSFADIRKDNRRKRAENALTEGAAVPT